jgi:peptidyl-prolyl cis-trans isomerase A (cyclophilin A)
MTRSIRHGLSALLTLLAVAATGCTGSKDAGEPPIRTAGGEAGDTARGERQPPPSADAYQVKLETSQGDVVIEVHPEWAPQGAERFRELVEAGFYDGCRFFRVIDGFMAQTGINGDPEVNAKWREKTIPDDPVTASNTRGHVTFATGGPDSRTTQFFINYGDNSRLDPDGFAPFGKVVEGMDVVDKFYSGYGDGPPYGRGPSQDRINAQGNAYLEDQFPRLDYIKTATIVGDDEPAARPANEPGNND